MYKDVNEYRRELQKYFNEELQSIMEQWADGTFTGPEQAATIQLNAQALGTVKAIHAILAYLDQPVEEEN